MYNRIAVLKCLMILDHAQHCTQLLKKTDHSQTGNKQDGEPQFKLCKNSLYHHILIYDCQAVFHGMCQVSILTPTV